MKLVREYINEKFTEDSDPIKDLGIGLKGMYEKWCKEHSRSSIVSDEALVENAIQQNKPLFVKYLLSAGADPDGKNGLENRHWTIGAPLRHALAYKGGKNRKEIIDLLLDAGANPNYADLGHFLSAEWVIEKCSLKIIKYIRGKIKKWNKLHKEKLEESFTEDSDPIKDLGIGKYQKYKKMLFYEAFLKLTRDEPFEEKWEFVKQHDLMKKSIYKNQPKSWFKTNLAFLTMLILEYLGVKIY